MTSYESIPMEGSPLDGSVPSTATPPRRWSLPVMFAAGLLVVCVVGYGAMIRRPAEKNDPSASSPVAIVDNNLEIMGAAKVPPCTLEECYVTNCNAEVAPFLCLRHNGGPHGGCSPTMWIAGTCEQQCDLGECAELSIPKDMVDCDLPCDPKEWCQAVGERLCPTAASYQCLTGSSAYGCTADKYQWAFKSSTATCSACCNADTCAK